MTDALIGLTLDRSGSMQFMWAEAVAGYNRFKQEQAEADGTAWLITTYFDDVIKTGYLGKDARNVPDLATNDDEVYPRGMTALVDATIKTIRTTEQWLKDHPDFDGKVFQVVITDGHENASESAPSALKELVANKEAEGWEFIYLAANVDLDATRQQYGFAGGQSMSYDQHTVAAAYGSTSNAILRSRAGGKTTFKDDERVLTDTGS